MRGRHASDDRRRFRRDLFRLVLLIALIAAVLVVGLVAARTVWNDDVEGEAATTTVVRPTTSEPAASTTTLPLSTTATSTTLADQSPSTSTTGAADFPVRDPAQTGVAVLNATNQTGLAGRVTERLGGLGYRTADPGNHSEDLARSLIWYLPGYDREALLLASQVPDATILPYPGNAPRAPLTVILGASYRE